MKDKYEISLWEDYLVPASGDPEDPNYVPEHYEEKKLCIIGSDTMTDLYRAFNPQLKSELNGTHTLTFKMFYTIKSNEINVEEDTFSADEDGNYSVNGHTSDEVRTPSYSTFDFEKTQNPFLSLLVNERKVKCFWKNQWYDFVIKNCREDSNGESITYTCTDVFINELSKNGFEIVLDAELENNMGTVLELATEVLDGTDWSLDSTHSDLVQQKKEEPVYEVTTLRDWYLNDQTTGDTHVLIPGNSKILVYYQQIQNALDYFNQGHTSMVQEIQIAYAATYEKDINSQLVTNAHCYADNVKWIKEQIDGVDCIRIANPTGTTSFYINVFYKSTVSVNYRAEHFVKQPISRLDTLTGKYCELYIANQDGSGNWSGMFSEGDEIYKYTTTAWDDALVVNNLVANASGFVDTTGWIGEGVAPVLYPPASSTQASTSYLRVLEGNTYYNDGIRGSITYIPNGFSIGETYIFRYKALTDDSGSPSGSYASGGITPRVCKFINSGEYKIPSDPDYFTIQSNGGTDNWIEWKLTCIKSVTRTDIYQQNVGLFLNVSTNLWIEEAQFFKEVFGEQTTEQGLTQVVRIDPGRPDIQSIGATKYYYFNHTTSQNLTDPTQISYIWSSTVDWEGSSTYLDLQYNENFEKIRSITAKRSNRFNLIQSLAQTFECWAEFIIEHDSTGRTIYNQDGTPRKYVRFKNDIGQETGIGFIYGIDLKTITRNILSDKIVTKTIVSQNSNEFGTDGFCTIARSKENYPRSSFLLNFDYYINQGLLDGRKFNNDLYDSTGSLGYYYNLHRLNTEYDSLTEVLSAKSLELTKQLSYQTVYEDKITSIQSNIQDNITRIEAISGCEWGTAAMDQWIAANPDTANPIVMTIESKQEELLWYQDTLENLESSITQLQTFIEQKEAAQLTYIEDIKALDLKFYKKYSRFIQEGTWKSEDYIDDDLYYLDAQSIAYTSSRPQVSYDISVMRISSLEEFKNKVFHLGDIAFIQDTEFFGYTYVNQIKTPYKEKVLISEITSNFDQPELDTIKVQNYKTQFEDLFQRITSATQSLQYAQGDYARAASIVEPTGIINAETLQNSIAINEQLVYSAMNDLVIFDSTGITVSDTTNPNHKVRITSGGLFITTDNGTTWKNAIRGEGVATQYLTTGSINTNNISIMDGNFTAFRWDTNGINAYYKLGGDQGINLSKFVRFDHFGIYGMDNPEQGGSYTPSSEDDIWNNAPFGMTWKGFFMKNTLDNGAHMVEVSSLNDIRVLNNSSEVIKIGKLSNDKYGIRISSAGSPVMETGTDGNLWLTGRLNIYSNNYEIGIGYLNIVTGDPSHRIFDANGNFIIYEDGSIRAYNGEFNGTIHATAGTIGSMTIDTANAIEMAIDNSRLSFDENGLSIYEGGLTIYDGEDNPIFYYDGENGLYVTGTGTFTGAVYATEGTFTGSIISDDLTANGGSIGGFAIDANGIYSTDSELNPSLVLYNNGRIDAQNINLGVGAHITDYILLGDNVYIWNPESNGINAHVLEIKDENNNNVVTLDDKGNLNIGDIELNGESSEIWGESFSITPNLATFTNVTVSGTISTAVFSQGHTQSVGGIMMFKPSYKIVEHVHNRLVLDQDFQGAVNDYVYVIKDDGSPVPGLIAITEIDGAVVRLSNYDYNGSVVSLIDIGSEDAVIIGVNSSGAASTFLKPRGITVSQFHLGQEDPEDPSTKYIDENINPKVFFGDLDTSGINFADVAPKSRGFGLYSENVYLTGSITTDLNSDKFAGIDTLNGVTASEIPGDNSRIVFWAGAADVTTEQIRLAPFQVTESGSIYASQGVFTGAILTDSYIRSADIYAARIHGTGKSESPVKDYGLAFYDATDGIVFYEGDTGGLSTPVEVFSIGTNGLKRGTNYFIRTSASSADFEGNNYYTRPALNATQYIHLTEDCIIGGYKNGENTEVVDSKITFAQDNGIKFSFGSNSSIMNITQSLIRMSTNNVQIDNTFLFADKMQYKKASNGYNLFVLS